MNDFKPKFIAWYEDEFRADRAVQRMRPIQRLLFKQLLHEAYYNADRPFLPNDDNQLWMLADADSLEHWRANKDAIIVKFIPFEDEDNRPLLRNKRVDEEWEKMVGQLEQRKNAGAASAKARSAKNAKRIGRSTVVGAENPERKKEPKKEENHIVPYPTPPYPTLPKSVQRSSNGRSTVVQDAEKAEGRKDGRATGWRLGFLKQIQEKAADKEIVFQTVPEHVYEFVESFTDLESAQWAVLDWLAGRSFTGLMNPDAAWEKMYDEIHGFVAQHNLQPVVPA